MVLSDKDIKEYQTLGKIKITHFNEENLRSGSYSLTLGNTIYKLKQVTIIDVRDVKQEYDEFKLTDEGYVIQPGEFLLSKSKEHITLSDDIVGLLSTRGSRAQIGLNVLFSSLLLEPGTNNHIALEILNASSIPIRIYPGIPMVKTIFLPLSSLANMKGRGKDFFARQELE